MFYAHKIYTFQIKSAVKFYTFQKKYIIRAYFITEEI